MMDKTVGGNWTNNTAAMTIISTSMSTLKRMRDLGTYQAAALPHAPGYKPVTVFYPNSYRLLAASRYPDIAWNVISYFVRPANVLSITTNPDSLTPPMDRRVAASWLKTVRELLPNLNMEVVLAGLDYGVTRSSPTGNAATLVETLDSKLKSTYAPVANIVAEVIAASNW